MEKELSGKEGLTRQDFLDIRELILQGMPLELIARRYKVGYERIAGVYYYFEIEVKKLRIRGPNAMIGHKDEPYFTEEEMLAGYPTYSYKDLSKTEKAFYELKINKKKYRDSIVWKLDKK